MWQSLKITTTEDLTLHLYRSPAEGFPLVCLHGFAEYGLHWDRFTRPFQGRYDLIAPDARAHGGSDAPPSRYSLEERTGDALAVLDALQLDRVALIGHSLGAHVAANLASRYPDRVRGLVLIDPGWSQAQLDDPEGERQRSHQHWGSVVESWLKRSPDRLRTIVERSFPLWQPEDVDRWLEGKALMRPEVMLPGLLEEMRPWTEIVADIRTPGLLLTGDADAGAIITPTIAKRVSILAPTLTVAHFPDAGHYVHLDAFSPAQVLVADFIHAL